MTDPADIVEGWLRFQGLSLPQLKRDDRRARVAGARREVMEYLRGEGWTYRSIAEFLDRDVTSIWHGLQRGNVPWVRQHNRRLLEGHDG